MSVVVSFRIPEELKRRMSRLKHVNWSEEVRRFLEEKVRGYEAKIILDEVDQHLKDLPELPKGTVAEWTRRDRDGR